MRSASRPAWPTTRSLCQVGSGSSRSFSPWWRRKSIVRQCAAWTSTNPPRALSALSLAERSRARRRISCGEYVKSNPRPQPSETE
eukprot:6649051-Heterocapsa_arctica.AAC.1